MACGLHCIVSDVASHREVLDGVGTVIPLQDLKERLPGEIKKAISDSKHSRSMGLKARARVLKCYSQEAVFSEISKEFGLLLKNN
jgi:glycosyltransferase involved in cell wall biosynthesis